MRSPSARAVYHLEKAAWVGTDLLLSDIPSQEAIGGYLAYPVGRDSVRFVCYDRAATPNVLASVTFDHTFAVAVARRSSLPRKLREQELLLVKIRTEAIAALSTDPSVKMYENTNFNYIPLVHEGRQVVYVLTGPSAAGSVILGNDYLVTFTKKGKVRRVTQLHRNIISIPTEPEADSKVLATIHTHTNTTGHLITPTDICTLLLYRDYTSWQRHQVVSSKYLSIWDMENSKLTVLPKSAIDGMRKQ